MISVDRQDGVIQVELDRGVTNAINLELVEELTRIVRQTGEATDVRALVIAGSNDKFFSIGFDLPHLLTLAREQMEGFYRAFNQLSLDLYMLPKPTVAALTGHSVAGGCILALTCDYRFVAEGKKLMGLNEIKLGLPVPYPADCMLRSLIGVRAARDILDSGALFHPEQARELGLVDQVLPLEQVRREALARAEALGAEPQQAAFAMIKQNRIEAVVSQVQAQLEAKQQYFLECWFRAETQERLREAAGKF
jgi:enoyl-CoA hydratase/carnithine racemase